VVWRVGTERGKGYSGFEKKDERVRTGWEIVDLSMSQSSLVPAPSCFPRLGRLR
jgi:hypothetical protein